MVSNKHSVLFFLTVVGIFCFAVFYFAISPTVVLAFESVILTVLGGSYSFSEKYRKFRTKEKSIDVLGVSSIAICLVGSITAFFLNENDSGTQKFVFCSLGILSFLYLAWDCKKGKEVITNRTIESTYIETHSEIKVITRIMK